MYKQFFIALTLCLLFGGLLVSVILNNLKTVSPRKLFRIKRDTSQTGDNLCSQVNILSIKDHVHDDIERYCRCSDGSYGFTCEKRFPNPCHKAGKFDISPDSVPDNFFVHCSNRMPYLFKCPGLLIWDHTLLTCTHIVPGLTPGKSTLYNDKMFTHFAKKFGMTADHFKTEDWNDMRENFVGKVKVNPSKERNIIPNKLSSKLVQIFDQNQKPVDLTELFEVTSEHSKLQNKLNRGGVAQQLEYVDGKPKAEISQKNLNNLLVELEAYTDKLYESLRLPTVQMLEASSLGLKKKQDKEQEFNRFIDKIRDIKADLAQYLEPASSQKHDERRNGLRAPGRRTNKITLQDNLDLTLHDTDLKFTSPQQNSVNSFNSFQQDKSNSELFHESDRKLDLKGSNDGMQELFTKKSPKTFSGSGGEEKLNKERNAMFQFSHDKIPTNVNRFTQVSENKKIVSEFLNSQALKETVSELVRGGTKLEQDKNLEELVANTVTNVLQNFIDISDRSTSRRKKSSHVAESLISQLLNKQDQLMRSNNVLNPNNQFLDEFPSPPKGQFLNNHEIPFNSVNENSQFLEIIQKKHLDSASSGSKPVSQSASGDKKVNELIRQNIKFEKILDKPTLDRRLEALNSHSLNKSPLFYWIDMPEALEEGGSRSVVSGVLEQLSKESSQGIKILFNFPPAK